MAQSSRAKLADFLSEPSDDREDLLARLTDEERRVFLYYQRQVPLAMQADPNRLPKPPFSEPEMLRFHKSAREKFTGWIVERVLDDRPWTLLDPP